MEDDLHLRGVDRATGEPLDAVRRRLDWLLGEGGVWRIVRSMDVDLLQEAALLSGGFVGDPEFGLRFSVPEGRAAHVVVGYRPPVVVLLPPHPGVEIALSAGEDEEPSDGATALRSLAATARLMPLNGGEGRVVVSGPTTMARSAALSPEPSLSLGETHLPVVRTLLSRPETFGATSYRLDLAADDTETLAQARETYNRVRDALVIGDYRPVPLPAEFGSLSGQEYVNEEHQVRARVPDGWEGRIIHYPREPLRFAIRKPGVSGVPVLIMADLGSYVDPKAIIGRRPENTDALGLRTEVVGEGAWDKGPTQGYQMLTRCTDESGKTMAVWFAGARYGTKLFTIGARTTPYEACESVKAGWAQFADSLKLGPEALDD